MNKFIAAMSFGMLLISIPGWTSDRTNTDTTNTTRHVRLDFSTPKSAQNTLQHCGYSEWLLDDLIVPPSPELSCLNTDDAKNGQQNQIRNGLNGIPRTQSVGKITFEAPQDSSNIGNLMLMEDEVTSDILFGNMQTYEELKDIENINTLVTRINTIIRWMLDWDPELQKSIMKLEKNIMTDLETVLEYLQSLYRIVYCEEELKSEFASGAIWFFPKKLNCPDLEISDDVLNILELFIMMKCLSPGNSPLRQACRTLWNTLQSALRATLQSVITISTPSPAVLNALYWDIVSRHGRSKYAVASSECMQEFFKILCINVEEGYRILVPFNQTKTEAVSSSSLVLFPRKHRKILTSPSVEIKIIKNTENTTNVSQNNALEITNIIPDAELEIFSPVECMQKLYDSEHNRGDNSQTQKLVPHKNSEICELLNTLIPLKRYAPIAQSHLNINIPPQMTIFEYHTRFGNSNLFSNRIPRMVSYIPKNMPTTLALGNLVRILPNANGWRNLNSLIQYPHRIGLNTNVSLFPFNKTLSRFNVPPRMPMLTYGPSRTPMFGRFTLDDIAKAWLDQNLAIHFYLNPFDHTQLSMFMNRFPRKRNNISLKQNQPILTVRFFLEQDDPSHPPMLVCKVGNMSYNINAEKQSVPSTLEQLQEQYCMVYDPGFRAVISFSGVVYDEATFDDAIWIFSRNPTNPSTTVSYDALNMIEQFIRLMAESHVDSPESQKSKELLAHYPYDPSLWPNARQLRQFLQRSVTFPKPSCSAFETFGSTIIGNWNSSVEVSELCQKILNTFGIIVPGGSTMTVSELCHSVYDVLDNPHMGYKISMRKVVF